MWRKPALSISILCLVMFAGGGNPLAGPPDAAARPAALGTETFDNVHFINVNNILMFVTNHGSFGRDLAGYFGNDYGTYYPYYSTDAIEMGTQTLSPLYAGGLWVGGRVGLDVRVTMTEYESEYTPGPMSEGTYQPDCPEFKVYKLYSDSASDNPNSDWVTWPADQGAPVDGYGAPAISGDQTLWAVYNDADPTRHDNYGSGAEPLGIEVHQRFWGYDRVSGAFSRVIIADFKIYNRGGNRIDDCYIGIWLDPDIGFREDDMGGCDPDDDLFYAYNADYSDNDYGTTPPAFGAKILRGPLIPSAGDSAVFDGHKVMDYRNLGLESYSCYMNGMDPDNDLQAYNVIQGLDISGNPSFNGSPYFYNGDPVTGSGDLDYFADDKKMVGGMGPFTFAAGDSQYVAIALIAGQGSSYLSSITALRQTAAFLTMDFPTAVEDGDETALPSRFTLRQNYPNPFNPGTDIAYELNARGAVEIDIFNVLGQNVRQLLRSTKPAGEYRVYWDGCDDSGRELPSGVYFYRATVDGESQARKMILMK